MGVMLSLDRPALARSRRPGRHARRPDDQAWAEALAAILRDEPPAAAGCLVRLAKTVLTGRLLPAETPIGWATKDTLAGDQGSGDQWSGDQRSGGLGAGGQGKNAPATCPPADCTVRAAGELSGACLLGQCHDSPGAPACASATCTHDCHRRAPAPGPLASRPPDHRAKARPDHGVPAA